MHDDLNSSLVHSKSITVLRIAGFRTIDDDRIVDPRACIIQESTGIEDVTHV